MSALADIQTPQKRNSMKLKIKSTEVLNAQS